MRGRRPYSDFHLERIRAHTKFNRPDLGWRSQESLTWDHDSWLRVLIEEAGEVARVLNEIELGPRNADGLLDNADRYLEQLREELVQVGAMTAAWIDAIDLRVREVVPGVPGVPPLDDEDGGRRAD